MYTGTDKLHASISSQIDDCTREWTFQPNSLDYVHFRTLNGSIPDWDFMFREAYRCLKPGGWIESMEPSPHITSDDGSLTDQHAWSQWGRIFAAGAKKNGRSWDIVEDQVQEKGMTKAGFKNVNVFNVKVCVGLNYVLSLST